MAHPLYQVLTTRARDQGARPPPSLLAETLGKTFDTGAQLASYAGLAPVTRRSGSSIRSEVHLPRRQQEAQARHIPVRLHLPALRPPGRTGPRHRGPAPLRAARRPHHRPAVWSESSFTYRRPGIHRAGHDHPEEKTRETAPSPPTTRHITEPSTRSDTRSKGSSRTPKDLEDPAYRPQRIIGNFPDNRYSSPRDHIHLNPMNKTPCSTRQDNKFPKNMGKTAAARGGQWRRCT